MIIITQNRVRAIITGCKTEMDLVNALRAHKVKYSFSVETGTMNIAIPCKAGTVRIYRTLSNNAPFMVRMDKGYDPGYTQKYLMEV